MLFRDRRDAGRFLARRLKTRAVELLEHTPNGFPKKFPKRFPQELEL